MPPPEHMGWFVVHPSIDTTEGRSVRIFEFLHQPNDAVLSPWARHFRQHYCLDTDIDVLRGGTGLERTDFLRERIFPNADNPGPAVRAGDFAEILVSDFLEYSLDHWVPRWRFSEKATPNESVKGTDIIGLRICPSGNTHQDTLTTFEVKAQFSGRRAKPRLQDAVDDAAKDRVRQGYTLLAMKRRAHLIGDAERVAMVERFQMKADRPFTEQVGAAAVVNNSVFDIDLIAATSTVAHPAGTSLLLLVIRGEDLMTLAHNLYERAANEA